MKKLAQGSVSVVIPAYNHAAFITRAIDSVLTQSRQVDEIIVVDDGSDDETAAIAEDIARLATPGRITVLRQSNRGAHAAINRGLEAAGGDYLTILNSDDSFAPDRIRQMIAALNGTDDIAFSRVRHIDAQDADLPAAHPLVAAYHDALALTHRHAAIGFVLLFYNLAVSSGNLFFTRNLWRRIGPFADLRLCHDWNWLLRALLEVEPIFLDEPLLNYRVHGSNTVSKLNDIAHSEASFCLESYFRAAAATPPPANPRAPSPHHWPGYFESALKDLWVEDHWIAAMRSRP